MLSLHKKYNIQEGVNGKTFEVINIKNYSDINKVGYKYDELDFEIDEYRNKINGQIGK